MANTESRRPRPFHFSSSLNLTLLTGREHVRTNFLLTRHLRDYLLLSFFLEHQDARVIRLS
jgi:hypothetical protein